MEAPLGGSMTSSPSYSNPHLQTSQPTYSPSASTISVSMPQLITYLLASKRSLSSVSFVLRANDLVTRARSSLEVAVVIKARTEFLQQGIVQQAGLLSKVRNGIEATYQNGVHQFQDVLKTLDEADIRLQETMGVLRGTIVEAAFRPQGESQRTLLSFVNEADVDALKSNLKLSIDESQALQGSLLSALASFSNSLDSLKSFMKSPANTSNPTSDLEDATAATIPPALQILSTTAAEMASLLDSLVGHFDLCVSAIRHTNGGFAAIKRAALSPSSSATLQHATSSLPDGVTISGVIREAEDSSKKHTTDGAEDEYEEEEEELGDEERQQMLRVLVTDADQVEDVVLEIHKLLSTMEESTAEINTSVETLQAQYNHASSAFSLLDRISNSVPTYMAAVDAFNTHWIAQQDLIGTQLIELEEMRRFYESYLASYDGLILETVRRRREEERMLAVVAKANETVARLWREEKRGRERFRREVGEWIPGDLWEGLREEAGRWEVRRVGGGGNGVGDGGIGEGERERGDGDDDDGRSNSRTGSAAGLLDLGETPVLAREVVEAARRREAERARG